MRNTEDKTDQRLFNIVITSLSEDITAGDCVDSAGRKYFDFSYNNKTGILGYSDPSYLNLFLNDDDRTKFIRRIELAVEKFRNAPHTDEEISKVFNEKSVYQFADSFSHSTVEITPFFVSEHIVGGDLKVNGEPKSYCFSYHRKKEELHYVPGDERCESLIGKEVLIDCIESLAREHTNTQSRITESLGEGINTQHFFFKPKNSAASQATQPEKKPACGALTS